jgi:hypothetical protein
MSDATTLEKPGINIVGHGWFTTKLGRRHPAEEQTASFSISFEMMVASMSCLL